MRTTNVRNRTTARTVAAILLAASLVMAGCGGDDASGDASPDADIDSGGSDNADGDNSSDGDNTPEGDDTAGDDTAGDDTAGDGDAGPAPTGGSVIFGDEEIPMQRLLCYFQEQPRAGLGGVFTHSAQAEGTNAAGEAVLLDMTRAVAEDGTVEFDLSFGVGDVFAGDYVEYYDTGQEVVFGDNSVSSDGDVDDFESAPVTLTFDLPCG